MKAFFKVIILIAVCLFVVVTSFLFLTIDEVKAYPNHIATGTYSPMDKFKQLKILKDEHLKNNNQRSSCPIKPNDVDNLPSEVDNSKKPYFPPLKRQSTSNSNASFAVTYYMATNQTAKARNWIDVSTPAYQLSPQFTYPLSGENDDPVSSLEYSLDVLKEHGTLTWEEMPFNPDDNTTWPNREQWRTALENRITDYGYIESINTMEGLNNLKSALNDGNILAFATYMKSWDYYQDMRTVDENPESLIDDPYYGEIIVTMMSNERKGGIVLAIVGYNDELWVDINKNRIMEENELGALKVITSRGESFANDGFIWIAYDALNNDAADHPSVFCNCRAAWIQAAETPYKPKVLAEITVDTECRSQLELYAGVNWGEATEPCACISGENPLEVQSSELFKHDKTIFDKGGDNPYCGTIVLDMTDYAISYGFYDPDNGKFKPGELTFSIGVADNPKAGKTIVQSVVFNDVIHNQYVTCDISDTGIVDSCLKWFSSGLNISKEDAPEADPSFNSLQLIQSDSIPRVDICSPSYEAKLILIPDKTAIYTLSSGSKLVSIEILNDANERLYCGNTLRNGTSVIRVKLKAKETYILKLSSSVAIGTVLRVNEYYPTQSDDTGLNSVLLSDGLLSPAFNSETMEYKIDVPKEIDSVEMEAIPSDCKGIVLLNGILTNRQTMHIPEDSSSISRIDVIAENGDIRTYSLHFIRPVWPSTKDATLSAIELSQGCFVKPFDSKSTSNTVLLNEYQDHVIIKPIKTDRRASLYINNILLDSIRIDLDNGKYRTIKLKVKSQTGNLYKTYTLKIIREKSRNNNLGSFELSASRLDQIFNPDLADYTVHLDENTSEVRIRALAKHALARVSPSTKTIRLNTGASKKVTFKVRAQSGASKTYTITVIRDASSQDGLKSLRATPSFYPVFSPETARYDISVQGKTSYVTIKAVKINKYAKLFIGEKQRTSLKIKILSGQTMTIDITVIAQAGNKKVYTITITKP